MKRKNNLYNEITKLENIREVYSKIEKRCHNKDKIYKWESIKDILIFRINKDLTEKNYRCGGYHKFIIYEPKKRVIMAQELYDKIVNHLVSEYILLPSIDTCLIDSNVASRRGKGTSYGVELYYKYRNECNRKYGKNNYYLLKLDIHHFFENINHDILFEMIKRKIKDKDALDIIKKIIYSYDKGLPIGYSNF